MANSQSYNIWLASIRAGAPSDSDLQRARERTENARKRTLEMERELAEDLVEIERLEREQSQLARPGGRFHQRLQPPRELHPADPHRMDVNTAPTVPQREEARQSPETGQRPKRRRRGKKGRSIPVFDLETAHSASQDPTPAPADTVSAHTLATAPWADEIWVKTGDPSPFGGDRWSGKPCKLFWGAAHHCDKGVDCGDSHDDPYHYKALINEYSEVYQHSQAKESHDLWKRKEHLKPTWERRYG